MDSKQPEELERAIAALRSGGLVAFPTETVYGLGADAENPAALARLYAAKGRPRSHPVIVHLGRAPELERWCARVPEAARRLGARFWPGPLTMILPRSPRVPDEVTGGQDSVGLRVPDHSLALALLDGFGGGVAAPSANRFGRLSPTRAEHVRADLGSLVDVVLDGGPCRVGVESTIVSLMGERPMLLRPGGILPAELAEVLGEEPVLPVGSEDPQPRAPGTLASHYAPRTPLEVVASERLEARIAELTAGQRRVAVLARARPGAPADALWVAAPVEAEAYARALYATLRALDAEGAALILVEEVPAQAAWSAVADRLRRAAHRDADGNVPGG